MNWVRTQAGVGSWEAAKFQIERLVEFGRLVTVDVDGLSRYVTDPMREYLDNIRDLVVEHTRRELHDELEAIAEELRERRQVAASGVISRAETAD